METLSSKELADRLTAEIGPDASFFRTENDRLYLTGFEIAGIIATGVIVSFCTGLFKGIKKCIGEYGEKLGEKAVDFLVARAQALLGQVEQVDATKPETVPEQLAPVYTELDQLLQEAAMPSVLDRDSEAMTAEIITEVKEYLLRVGYPDDVVEARAVHLVTRVHLTMRGD